MALRTPTLAALAACLVAVGCASSPPPSPAAATTPAATPTATTPANATTTPVAATTSAEPKCDLVCQGAKVSSLSAGSAEVVRDADSHTVAQTKSANRIFDGMHDDLLACYKARVKVAPKSEGTVTFEILIGADGKIQRLDATGGDTLGSAKECMTKRIQKATFDPPHGGGTLKILVPFTLRLQPADEST